MDFPERVRPIQNGGWVYSHNFCNGERSSLCLSTNELHFREYSCSVFLVQVSSLDFPLFTTFSRFPVTNNGLTYGEKDNKKGVRSKDKQFYGFFESTTFTFRTRGFSNPNRFRLDQQPSSPFRSIRDRISQQMQPFGNGPVVLSKPEISRFFRTFRSEEKKKMKKINLVNNKY